MLLLIARARRRPLGLPRRARQGRAAARRRLGHLRHARRVPAPRRADRRRGRDRDRGRRVRLRAAAAALRRDRLAALRDRRAHRRWIAAHERNLMIAVGVGAGLVLLVWSPLTGGTVLIVAIVAGALVAVIAAISTPHRGGQPTIRTSSSSSPSD